MDAGVVGRQDDVFESTSRGTGISGIASVPSGRGAKRRSNLPRLHGDDEIAFAQF
jgi:hypothetical protein